MSEVVRYVLGESGYRRARIVKISNNAYRVDVERLYAGTDADGFNHGDFWAALNDWTSYTDTIERAIEIATENVRSSEANV
jgi:hypothetical protein